MASFVVRSGDWWDGEVYLEDGTSGTARVPPEIEAASKPFGAMDPVVPGDPSKVYRLVDGAKLRTG